MEIPSASDQKELNCRFQREYAPRGPLPRSQSSAQVYIFKSQVAPRNQWQVDLRVPTSQSRSFLPTAFSLLCSATSRAHFLQLRPGRGCNVFMQ